jgi:hypothetical protein
MTPHKEKKMASPSWAHAAKIVEVTVDPKLEDITDPKEFRISKGRFDQVKWVAAAETYFTVEFNGESPFYESQFSSDAPYSGLVRRDILGDPLKTYKYTVRAGGRTVDPGGIIDR